MARAIEIRFDQDENVQANNSWTVLDQIPGVKQFGAYTLYMPIAVQNDQMMIRCKHPLYFNIVEDGDHKLNMVRHGPEDERDFLIWSHCDHVSIAYGTPTVYALQRTDKSKKDTIWRLIPGEGLYVWSREGEHFLVSYDVTGEGKIVITKGGGHPEGKFIIT